MMGVGDVVRPRSATAGFEDGEREPSTKKYWKPLEAAKCKAMDSPLELPEGTKF